MPAAKSKMVKGGRKDLDIKSSSMRPWNMNTQYEPSYCAETVNLMSKGMSIYEVARHLGVGTNSMYRWAEMFPEFKQALDDGKDYRRAWLDHGFRDYMDEKFDIKGYTVALTADYGYNDKTPQIHFDMRNQAQEDAVKTVNEIIEDLHKTTI